MSTQFYDEGGIVTHPMTPIMNTTGSSILILTGSQWERLGSHTIPETWSWTSDPVDDAFIEQDWIDRNPKISTRFETTFHRRRMTPAWTRLFFGLSRREERIMRGVERKQLIHKGGKP